MQNVILLYSTEMISYMSIFFSGFCRLLYSKMEPIPSSPGLTNEFLESWLYHWLVRTYSGFYGFAYNIHIISYSDSFNTSFNSTCSIIKVMVIVRLYFYLFAVMALYQL